MKTIADLIKERPNTYELAIAKFSLRMIDRDERTVTFVFSDESKLTFKIQYEVMQ